MNAENEPRKIPTLPFRPCGLEEPYLFISYAHANADMVYPYLIELYNRGYRVWYDEGIEAVVADWNESVEKAIETSSVFMLFLSLQAMESYNVKSEVIVANDLMRERARSENPYKIIVIRLDDAPYLPGWILKIGATQITPAGDFNHAIGKVLDCACKSLPEETRSEPPTTKG